MALLISPPLSSASHSLNTRSQSGGRLLSLWRADYSPESPLQPKSPRCRWAACLISSDYSLIGILQNTMTSALFIDGINHILAELKIPPEFILFSLNLESPDPLSPCPLSSCYLSGQQQFLSVVDALLLVKHLNCDRNICLVHSCKRVLRFAQFAFLSSVVILCYCLCMHMCL